VTKDQFIKQLESSLNKLSSTERRDILQDYQEHFEIGLEEGKTEDQIASSLGSPDQIAKELLASYHLEKADTRATTGDIIRSVWTAIGLGFFNLMIVLGPIIALAGIIVAGWAAGAAFICSPLLVLINNVINPGSFKLFDLFFSIALCGAGIFGAIIMYFITKVVVKGFLWYVRFNVSLVKGGLKHE
jgi:uncharacterized membrane protein